MTIQISGSMGRMDNYIRAIWKAGGQARAGYCPEPDLTCDGLLLAGGGDIAPERYGQGMEGSLPPDPLRDEAELALFRAFYGAGKPILGICRGHQLINVALGGTLIGMTGILRSATADLSTTATWAVMTSVLCWGCGIRANGFAGWLKGFADPVPVMLPMNIISEISQPISMAFRHFGNIAGGGVLTSLLYTALATLSGMVLGAVGSNAVVSALLLALGLALLVWGVRVKKPGRKIAGVLFAVTGGLALLGLTGVPYLQVGVPGILSLYFDVFSGGVQALVFSLLTMVYIGNCCPPPEETEPASGAE